MGLNTNYRLLIEGNKSDYHIPEYKSYYNSGIITQEFAMQAIADFNQEIRESQAFISSLAEIECVTESVSMADIWDKITSAAMRIAKAIGNLIEKIKEIINKIIDSIKNKLINHKDKVETNLRDSERNSILEKALNEVNKEGKIITINSLEPTKELLDDNFPNVSVISGDLVKMATDTMSNYCINMAQKDGTNFLDDSEVKYSESFAKFIESEKKNMLDTIFGNYSYDPDEIMKSAIEVSDKAYGIKDKEDVIITTNLYMTACDNVKDASKIIEKMNKLRDTTTKDFNIIKDKISNITKAVSIFNSLANNNYTVDMKKNYHEAVRTITSRINRSLTIINQIVNANFTLVTRKAYRINELFGYNGDSLKVKNRCHRLITWYLNMDKNIKTESVYNTFDNIINEFDPIDEFSSFVAMANDAFIDESYTDLVLRVINEADENNTNKSSENNEQNTDNASNNKVQDTEKPDNDTTVKKSAKTTIMNWLKTFIGKFGEIIRKAKNRVEELIIKGSGKSFWNENKEKIKNLTFTDTKVNQWFNFNIDAFSKSTIVRFQDAFNDKSLSTDEAIQDKILKSITPNPPTAENNQKFSDRIKKAYQGEYINDEQGGGKTLSEVNYDHAKICAFIDDICNKGFGGEALGKVAEDYKNVDADHKDVISRYDQYAQQMSNKSESPKQDEHPKDTQPANASAILVDDNNFNLAEHFGLMHEATFTIGQADSKNAGVTIGTNKGSDNKELDAMIKRCFQYNTIAVTAKITAAIAAYKQYMGLFKAVYHNRSGENKQEQNNDQKTEEKSEDKK